MLTMVMTQSAPPHCETPWGTVTTDCWSRRQIITEKLFDVMNIVAARFRVYLRIHRKLFVVRTSASEPRTTLSRGSRMLNICHSEQWRIYHWDTWVMPPPLSDSVAGFKRRGPSGEQCVSDVRKFVRTFVFLRSSTS